jgi:hypothetical protein
MVLFFLLKPIFGGCIASPAPFSGFCRRFLYNPQTFDFTPFSKNAEDASHSGKVPRRSSFHAF